jgi:hypothetical protein
MRSRRNLASCPNSAGWWRDAQTPQSQFGIATASTPPVERLKRRGVSLNVDATVDAAAVSSWNTESTGGPLTHAIEGARYSVANGMNASVRLCLWFFALCNHRFLEKLSFSGVK